MSTSLPAIILIAMVGITTSLGGPVPCTGECPDPVTQEVTFRLVPGTNLSNFLADVGIVGAQIAAVPSRDTYMYPVPAGQDPEIFSNGVGADPRAIWAEANYLGDAPEGSGRSFYFNEVNVDDFYTGQGAWGQVRLDDAFATQPDADGITIAVIDSGLDVGHPTMAGRVAAGGWNFIDNTANVADSFDNADNDNDGDIDEGAGHGTHVAGIISYAAPDAMILPIKVLDSEGNTNNFIVGQAIYYAIDQGADVINVSIGSTYASDIVEDAIDEAHALGIIVVAAAGNTANFVDQAVANLPEYPAMFDTVLSVGSVDASDIKSAFSNFASVELDGDEVNLSLVAPGEDFYSAIPTSSGFDYAAWDGTSFATPLVSSAAALLLARHPDWIANESRISQVEAFLRGTAAHIDDLPGNAPWAGEMGAGRLDTAAAMELVVGFSPSAQTAAGIAPLGIALGDFNRDRNLDVVITNDAVAAVQVRFGDGTGAFGPPISYPTASSADAVVIGDFNGDNWDDLAVASSFANSVRIYLNDQTGALTNASDIPVALAPTQLAAADIDRDGTIDVIVSHELSNQIWLLLNDGTGQVTAQPPIATGFRPYSIDVGFINNDIWLDMVTANRDGNDVSLHLSTGPGTFAPAVSIAGGTEPRAAIIGDFDVDGDQDIAIGNNDSEDVIIRWNAGDGTFPTSTRVPMRIELGPSALATADLDCDGDNDILVVSGDAPEGFMSIILNERNGDLLGPIDYNVGQEPAYLATGDIDRDGDMDVVTTNEFTNDISFLRNQTCAQRLIADMNCDRIVSVSDIGGFVLALTDPAGHAATFPNCNIMNADVNNDSLLTVGDIGPFVDFLLN